MPQFFELINIGNIEEFEKLFIGYHFVRIHRFSIIFKFKHLLSIYRQCKFIKDISQQKSVKVLPEKFIKSNIFLEINFGKVFSRKG